MDTLHYTTRMETVESFCIPSQSNRYSVIQLAYTYPSLPILIIIIIIKKEIR